MSRKYIYKEKIGDKRIIYIFGIKISYKKKIKKVKKFCPICNNMNIFDDYGTELRHNSKCPVCDSLERHRFLSFIYKFEFLSNKMPKTILHIAPEKSIYNLLSNVRNIEYYSVDISPEQYPYAKNIIKADVLNLPFEDKKFDIIISNQVIEHIKDEGKFIKELARALKDEGKIILNLPYDPNIKDVFQDSSICSPEDKLYYYGQHDHEKIYGQKLIADYDNLNINRISEKDYFSEYLINLMGLQREGGRLRDAYLLITKNV